MNYFTAKIAQVGAWMATVLATNRGNHTMQKPNRTSLSIFLGFFIGAFIINKISTNYLVAGGDFYQLINPSRHLSRYFYAWINQGGQGAFNTIFPSYIFYVLLSAVDKLGFNSSIIAGFTIFIVLYASYISFYFSIKLIYEKISYKHRISSSLLYALNGFTLTFFTYPWGFTHHVLFYIFIPPLILFFVRIIFKDKVAVKDWVVYTLIFLLSTISYNNIAFFAALLLMQLLILILSIIMGKVRPGILLIRKMAIVGFIYFLEFGYFLTAFFLSNKSYEIKLLKTEIFGGNTFNFIKFTSNSILNIIKFNIHGFNSSSTVISLAYVIVLLYLLIKINKNTKTLTIFLSLFLIYILLAVRLHAPFLRINSIIYKTLFFSLFRSPDKIFMFIPFIYAVLLSGLFYYSKLKDSAVITVFVILILIPYPFYTGGIVNVLKKPNPDGYKFIVKIPKEYIEIKNIINEEKKTTSVISMPYSVVNSIGWSNYPKWHFVGFDILHLLFNKYYISANTYDHPALETRLSFKNFNDNEGSSSELLKLIQKFSGQFIIFHKDISPEWIMQTAYIREKIETLNIRKKIKLLDSNNYFDLYKLRKKYVMPIIHTNSGLRFQKINPAKYKIILTLKQKENIIFNQAHNSQWKLYLKRKPFNVWQQKSGYYKYVNATEYSYRQKLFEGEELSYLYKKPIFDNTHHLVNDYANAWTINPRYIKKNYPSDYYKENPDGSIDIELILYFKPQTYFYLGLIITALTLLSCFGYLIWDWLKYKGITTPPAEPSIQ